MEYVISNKYLKAHINSFGAELVKLFGFNGKNRLHEPSADTWSQVSPVLFPQVSRFIDNKYIYDNKEYNMPMHGFIRDNELSVYYKDEQKITFMFQYNEETLKIYPFKFIFYVTYELKDARLDVSYKVVNVGENKMYFMVGGHPGFKIPFNENETYDDYYIQFPFKENMKAMQLVNGYVSNVYKPYLENEDKIQLRHDLFIPDAIILKDLKSKYVDLLSKKSDYHLRFYFAGFDIFAIWCKNKENCHYVCFEPWNIQKEFVKEYEKMDLLTLRTHETYNVSFTIEVIK